MDIKINIKIQNQVNLLANATISLLTDGYGWITIKGFQIWKSNILNARLGENINIKPTSQRNNFGKYITIVFIEGPEFWEKMETEIYQAYLDKLKNELPVEDIVIPDDFPF